MHGKGVSYFLGCQIACDTGTIQNSLNDVNARMLPTPGPAEAKVHWPGLPVLSAPGAYFSVYVEGWGMLPQENLML